MRDARAWAQVGHRLGRLLGPVFADPTEFIIISTSEQPEFYVQLHGEPEGDFYAEAASGLYGGEGWPTEVGDLLAALGWDEPLKGAGGDKVLNWSRYWVAPVDPYAVVLLTVRTLRDVFDLDPTALLEVL